MFLKRIEIMKYKQLIAELTALGCYVVRHGANHDIWFSPKTGCRCAVPRHGSKEVPKGTETEGINPSLMRQYAAGITMVGQKQYDKIHRALHKLSVESAEATM